MIRDLNQIEILDDAERLIILRKRFNLSQFQFAKELGISQSYLGQVERGNCLFSTSLKERINDYLKQETKMYE
jgi:transcriptional regulator with XRE-family HTH domain